MSERRALEAVPGLSRTDSIPRPPARRPRRDVPPVAPVDGEEHSDAASGPDHEASAGGAAGGTSPEHLKRATGTRAITLSLPGSLVLEFKERARATQVTQADFLMDALTAAQGRLGELLAAQDAATVDDGLFLRRAPLQRAPEPLSTLSLRLLSANVSAIDVLVDQAQAPSRSALCLAALRYYLAEDRDDLT